MKVISRYLSTLALVLVLVQTTGVLAKSANTLSVQGRAPVATGVTLTGPAVPLVGDTLQGAYVFGDADLDREQGSLLRWLDDSGVELGVGSSLLLTSAAQGKQVRFAVTPGTDSAVTDPYQGIEATSLFSPVVQGRPDPTQSTFTADKSTIVADGVDNAILTLTLKDNTGSPITGIRERVTLDYSGIEGTDAISLIENDRGNGIYEYILTGTRSGIVTLTPQLDGSILTTVLPSLQIVLTPNPATAVVDQLVTTTDNQPADNVSSNLLTATVRDVEGNLMPGATVEWSHSGTTATLGAITSVTDNNGQSTITLKNTWAETVTVTAKVQTNPSDPGVTSITHFALYPLLETLVVGTNHQPANNKALNTVVATFKDLNGTVLANEPVTLYFSSNKESVTFDHASPWTTTTDAAGKVTVSLRDSVTEDVEVNVYTENSRAVQKMVLVNFTELMITRFLKPEPTPMTWQNADNYCNALGYRLPTRNELQALYFEVSPSHSENYELCNMHGWPMAGKCGGTYDDYWTAEVYEANRHWNVYMQNGNAGELPDVAPSQVACIRR